MCTLEAEPGPCPKTALLFLNYPSLVFASLPFLISNCSNLPFGTQGRSWRLEGDRKASMPRSPTGSCLVSVRAKAMRLSWVLNEEIELGLNGRVLALSL